MANEKILVVDDDANICELLRLYLTKEGYQVTVANDGEEGLEKFNAVKPDMVLYSRLDYQVQCGAWGLECFLQLILQ